MNLVLLFGQDFVDPTHVVLTGRRLDHIVTVHHAKAGDTLRVGKLNGKMGEGRVTAIDPASCRMEVALDKDPPVPLPLTLLIALPRPKALRRIVETAAAMGIKRLYIMESWRVEKSFWSSPLLAEKELAEYCVLGLEQSCDTVMPAIAFRKRFKPFVEDEVPGLIKGGRAFVAHPRAATPCPRAIDGQATLAVGPEGGFIPFEIELLEKQGFEAVNFGQRILRTEAFVPAALGRLF
jgi:16S rRNA (uracil1498-N3)-methyltransferase